MIDPWALYLRRRLWSLSSSGRCVISYQWFKVRTRLYSLKLLWRIKGFKTVLTLLTIQLSNRKTIKMQVQWTTLLITKMTTSLRQKMIGWLLSKKSKIIRTSGRSLILPSLSQISQIKYCKVWATSTWSKAWNSLKLPNMSSHNLMKTSGKTMKVLS